MTFMLTKSSARFGISCRALTSILGLCAGGFFATFFSAQTALAQSPPSSGNRPGQTGQATVSSDRTEATSTSSTTITEPTLVITGDELPSAYGAPGSFSRSRFSATTTAYVLPPFGVYAGLIYEGDAFDDSTPDNLFTQEIELGLPHRFGLAVENRVEHFAGETMDSTFSVEGRYAFADWNKIPLNPTIFAEYKFGVGKIGHEEGPPPPPEEAEEEEGKGPPDIPDAYEFRLLLAQEFGGRFEWAFNGFFEKENTGDRGREWGFAQSIQTPIWLPHERLKVGLEMQYKNFTVKDTRGSPINRFNIGPSVSFKPTARMRFDLSPLFGVTKDSADAEVFAIFSYVFGGEGSEAEAPASTRNR
jgi:hypothetical protein